MSLLHALPLLLLADPAFLGVVRVSRNAQEPAPGAVLTGGSTLSTSVDGWLEAHLSDDSRLRLSADTRVFLHENKDGQLEIELSSGRAWIQRPSKPSALAQRWRVENYTAFVPAGASVVIEYGAGTGIFIATPRKGSIRVVSNEGVFYEAGPGEMIETRAGLRVTPGGKATTELVAQETRQGLGDLFGLLATLLEWTRKAPLGANRARGVSEILRLDPEVSGTPMIHSRTVEEAVRPPPFFEEEVPPRGPNVRVDVEFRE